MNFGQLNDIINICHNYLKANFKEKKTYSNDDILNAINKCYIINKSDKVDYYMIENIIHRFFKNNKFKNKLKFKNGDNCFRDYDIIFDNDEIKTTNIKIPKDKLELEKHFQKLFHYPQPEQRSEEWYLYRKTRITASDTATAIDLNPYEPVEHFIVKKVDGDRIPFKDGFAVYHGRKYEPIATMIYEHIYNNKVTEFGCLPSQSFKILGASPDGICSKSTLDNKFSDRLGTMLEIKCPVRRKIKTEGPIAGVICPYYYYCQVQQQLECCNLEVCDFWQCNLEEYNSREEYLLDNINCKLTEGTKSKEIPINKLITSGAIIELMPKEFIPRFEEDEKRFLAHYLYPPRMDLTKEQYNKWIIETIETWKKKYPELEEKFYFEKVIYWKMKEGHNVAIKRDRKWFKSIYPILEDTWKKVLYYRENPEEIDILYEKGLKRKNFWKVRLNTKFKIDNDLVDNKILFLDDEVKQLKDEDNELCDFID